MYLPFFLSLSPSLCAPLSFSHAHILSLPPLLSPPHLSHSLQSLNNCKTTKTLRKHIHVGGGGPEDLRNPTGCHEHASFESGFKQWKDM